MPRAPRPGAGPAARALASLLVAIGAPAAVLAAPAAGEPSAVSREEELAEIRIEIRRLEATLGRLQSDQRGLEGGLARTEVELSLQERRLAEAVAARDVIAGALADGEARAAHLDARLAGLERDLRQSLVWLYRVGRQGPVRLFLTVSADPDLLAGMRVLRYLVRRSGATFQEVLALRSAAEAERALLAERRRELDDWVRAEGERRAALAVMRREQAAVLAQLAVERRHLAARAAELAERERKLSDFLALLYGHSPELAGAPIQSFRGVLDWPADGRVTAGFGPMLDRRYRTQVPHNGVDVATVAGAEVRSVFAGQVLYAAPFEGYGLTAIVHHPGRVFSLYARLAEILVGEGDMVTLGQVIGRSADALYFEIREENRAQDPLLWLR